MSGIPWIPVAGLFGLVKFSLLVSVSPRVGMEKDGPSTTEEVFSAHLDASISVTLELLSEVSGPSLSTSEEEIEMAALVLEQERAAAQSLDTRPMCRQEGCRNYSVRDRELCRGHENYRKALKQLQES